MKNITITIEDEVYILCMELVKERKLSSTINELLKGFLQTENNEFMINLAELKKEKDIMQSNLREVSAKILILEKQKEEAKEKSKQEALMMLKGLRANNPLRDMM